MTNPYQTPKPTPTQKTQSLTIALGLLLAFTSFLWLLNATGPVKTQSQIAGWVITTDKTKWAIITALQAGAGCIIIALGSQTKENHKADKK